MKENQPYDEKRYTQALRNMVQQCIDYEDTHEILTEWDNLVQEGYEDLTDQNYEKMISLWWKAWEIFQKIVETAEYKIDISGLIESQDYQYPIDAWLQDLEMELSNVGEHEKRVEFCRKILEMLDWSFDDASNFKSAIGEELYAEGKVEQGKKWFEDWLKKEPHNQNALSVWSWCVQEEKGAEEAYKIIRREVIGIVCMMENELLFERARLLAQHLEIEKTECEKYLTWAENIVYKRADAIVSGQHRSHYGEAAELLAIVGEMRTYFNIKK